MIIAGRQDGSMISKRRHGRTATGAAAPVRTGIPVGTGVRSALGGRSALGDRAGVPSRSRARRSRPCCISLWALALWGCCGVAGCATSGRSATHGDAISLRDRALQCLSRGLDYRHNPVVRAEAIEAMQKTAPNPNLPKIRNAVHDASPGVRFAACVALGMLRDKPAYAAICTCLNDPDPNVRAAAVFACHRLDDKSRTGELADLLLSDPDPGVRCNAAMLLGKLGEPGAVKVLARAMRDKDERVRDHALEAMALLNVEEANRQLAFLANSGLGSQEAFALSSLALTKKPAHAELFRLKLAESPYVEARLAAARGLGWLGDDEGFDIALRALRFYRPRRNQPDDPPAQQVLRVKTLSSAALGAIGDPRALKPLARVMEDNDDPRLQVAAARAILEILDRRWQNPFPVQASEQPSRR